MNYPAYIAHMEALTGRRLPALYHRLAADGMLDWGTGAPDWYKTTYPRLLIHPPLLFIGNDFEIPAADQLPPEIDDDLCFTLKPAYRHRFIAFGQSGAGDAYAFAYLDDAAAEPCITCIYHDDNSRLLAADLHDFIYIMLLQANRTWGSEDDDDATYRAKLYAQLESHRPYLKPTHYDTCTPSTRATSSPSTTDAAAHTLSIARPRTTKKHSSSLPTPPLPGAAKPLTLLRPDLS